MWTCLAGAALLRVLVSTEEACVELHRHVPAVKVKAPVNACANQAAMRAP